MDPISRNHGSKAQQVPTVARTLYTENKLKLVVKADDARWQVDIALRLVMSLTGKTK